VLAANGQLKEYKIGIKRRYPNGLDKTVRSREMWINRFDEARGEPGYEEGRDLPQ